MNNDQYLDDVKMDKPNKKFSHFDVEAPNVIDTPNFNLRN